MLLIISGLSGAGKSTALHALEDQGVFCTDNLPVDLLADWVQLMDASHRDAAVCLDLRSAKHADLLKAAIANLPESIAWEMVYIDADDVTLIRRFSTARRRHPIYAALALPEAIYQERTAILPLKDVATHVLDSSHLTPYELADLVETFWRQVHGLDHVQKSPVCSLVSFSYQRGIPSQADMVMDMRFLPNPHYDPLLAPLTGRDQAIHDYFIDNEEAKQTLEWLQQWLLFVWPKLKRERKRYFTLAIGCSGGRHRSVYMVECVAKWMKSNGLETMVRHREIDAVMKNR
ncbi:MAG: RNase adapter RapZ [Zetaproteobacteria bacterium]|nr:RNase adapter RapZ [Zetaproteobacteria bacterium]